MSPARESRGGLRAAAERCGTCAAPEPDARTLTPVESEVSDADLRRTRELLLEVAHVGEDRLVVMLRAVVAQPQKSRARVAKHLARIARARKQEHRAEHGAG